MSKYLRECIELFGDYKSVFSNSKLVGPFYCGLSFVAAFPHTYINLRSPTSTSRHKEVAIKFTGDAAGIIIEFDNNDRKLHGFDCSWISQFKEESEVLFMGGANEIHIVGVTVLSTLKNYSKYFSELVKFDNLINGRYSESSSELSIICNLIDGKHTDKYESNCFALFTNNKLHIELNYLRLKNNNTANILMYKMEIDAEIHPFSDSISTNLFRGDVIFKLFSNLESIVISDVARYQFSLKYLCSMISKWYSLQSITIYDKYDRWIHKVWTEDNDKLILMFSQHQFDIQYNEYPHTLTINRDVQ